MPVFLQTFTRLQKLMVSLSHCGMISLMDNVAEGHDEEILEWQDEFSQMLSVQVNQLSDSEVGPVTRVFFMILL